MEHIIEIDSIDFEPTNFLNGLREEIRENIYSCVHSYGKVRIYSHEPINNQVDIQEIKDIMLSHKKTPKAELRVHRVLSKDLNPLTSDFTILGFRKISPSYDRGRKTKSIYKCINKDEIIVEKVFTDVMDVNGNLKELSVTFNYYDEDGEIGLNKTEVVKEFNKFEAETEHRKRRYRQFDYLRASVKGTPYEYYIAILINHFHDEIQSYKDDGLFTLHTAMVNETNTQIRTILDSSISRNDGQGATTVMKSMQYQIGTINIEDL